jgi:hypothetical protein
MSDKDKELTEEELKKAAGGMQIRSVQSPKEADGSTDGTPDSPDGGGATGGRTIRGEGSTIVEL